MRNTSRRYYVGVQVEGKQFSRRQGTVGAPFDPTYIEEWECQTQTEQKMKVIFCYGMEFIVEGKQIAYFDDPGPNFDGRNLRAKQRVQYCNLFRKLAGVPFTKVSKALNRALEDYQSDPMGCLEDYE